MAARAPTSSRLAALLRRRWVRGALAAAALGGAAGGLVPLLEVPGYELGIVACLAVAVLGLPVGFAAARDERSRAAPSPAAAALAAAGVLAMFEAVLLAANAAHAALRSPCSPLASAPLLTALALPSALLASSLGVACAEAAGRRARAAALYGAAAVGSVALDLAGLYFGPAAHAFDPLLGWFPGPLYDEALRLEPRLLLARLAATGLAVALAAGAEGAARRRAGRRAFPAAALASGSLLLAASALVAGGAPYSHGRLAAALGGRSVGARCTLVYASAIPSPQIERLARDCEYDAFAVASALGLDAPARVTVYVYRSADEKRRLVGAAATSYTKPWLGEVHLNLAPAPHPVLRHELVHALAASFAPLPLRVPARAGVLVSAGLVEGLAMAVDVPPGEWTLHEWARALRDLGFAPDVERLLSPSGFFGAAPARAYTAAGSFLRYLLERDGPAPVRALYRDGDFQAAFGVPLRALVAEWREFLDGVAVPAALRSAAEARFRTPSLFARRCAREVACLEAQAGSAVAVGDGERAAQFLRRAAGLSGDPRDRRAAADALRSAGELAAAEEEYRAALAGADEADAGHGPGGPGAGHAALRASLLAGLGDISWIRNDPGAAAERYQDALALGLEDGEARLLEAKLAAVTDSSVESDLRTYLLQLGDPALALERATASPLGAYLAGRASLARGAVGDAARLLTRAAEGPLPARIAAEAPFQLAAALCESGDPGAGHAKLEALARQAPLGAVRQRAQDAARRCAFESYIGVMGKRRERPHPEAPDDTPNGAEPMKEPDRRGKSRGPEIREPPASRPPGPPIRDPTRGPPLGE